MLYHELVEKLYQLPSFTAVLKIFLRRRTRHKWPGWLMIHAFDLQAEVHGLEHHWSL